MARPKLKDAVPYTFSIPRKVANHLRDNKSDKEVREISEWVSERLIAKFDLADDTSLAQATIEAEESAQAAEKAVKIANQKYEIYLAMFELHKRKKAEELPSPDFNSHAATSSEVPKFLNDINSIVLAKKEENK